MTPQEATPTPTPTAPPQSPEEKPLSVEGIRRVRTRKNVGRPRTGDFRKYNASTHYVIPKRCIDDFVHAALLGRLDGYMRIAFISKLQDWFHIPSFDLAQERARQMKISSIARKERQDEKNS